MHSYWLWAGCSGDENELSDLILFADKIYEDISSVKNITYSDVDPDNQVMNVYWPTEGKEISRPLLVIAGGGNWYPSNLNFLEPIATRFAEAGYVVAAFRYISDSNDELDPTYRNVIGVGDIKAAIRFFRKDAATANTYKVDTDNIFVGGFGSGGFLAA